MASSRNTVKAKIKTSGNVELRLERRDVSGHAALWEDGSWTPCICMIGHDHSIDPDPDEPLEVA